MIKTEDILNLTEDKIKKNPVLYNLAIKTTVFYDIELNILYLYF